MLVVEFGLYFMLLKIACFQASGGSCRVGTAHHQRGHVARQGSQPFIPNRSEWWAVPTLQSLSHCKRDLPIPTVPAGAIEIHGAT